MEKKKRKEITKFVFVNYIRIWKIGLKFLFKVSTLYFKGESTELFENRGVRVPRVDKRAKQLLDSIARDKTILLGTLVHPERVIFSPGWILHGDCYVWRVPVSGTRRFLRGETFWDNGRISFRETLLFLFLWPYYKGIPLSTKKKKKKLLRY